MLKEDPKKITEPVHLLDPMDTSSNIYRAMNEYQRFSYESAYNEVNYHLLNRNISWSHVSGKVLDFGCQQGTGSYVFASHGAEVTIVDRAFSYAYKILTPQF